MSFSAPDPFVSYQDLSSLGLQVNQSDLLKQWLALVQATFPGYEPNSANLEFVQAAVWAMQLAALHDLASNVSDAIFRNYGEKLVGIQPHQGSRAAAVVTVTAVDTAGHTLDAGTQITLNSLGFTTTTDITIPPGLSSATATVEAVQIGTAFNGAGAPVETVSQIDWVSSVTLVTSASGGQDPEADSDFLTRLAVELRLQAPRPITASDYGTIAEAFTPAAGTDQQIVGRATAIDGYDPPSGYPSAVLPPSGSPTMVWGVGAARSGTFGNEREVTVFATDALGFSLTNDTYVALQAYLDSLREANFIVNCGPPIYPTVYVTVTVKTGAGYDTTAVQLGVQQAITRYISPTQWGLPLSRFPSGWLNTVTVFQSVLEATVQNVRGVDHIVAGTLKFGTSAAPTNTTDLTLSGACVLPTATSDTVTVTVS